jgi:ribonuclease P protein component
LEPVRRVHRFTPGDRLRRRGDFDRVYAAGRKAWAQGFTLFVAAGETDCHRLGLTVSRRVGNAVIRNRVKRRFREVFRTHRQRLPDCYDIVVNARTEVTEVPFAELAEAFVRAVQRASRARPAPRAPRPSQRRERNR